MTHLPASILLILIAYLFGSLPVGLLVGRMVKGIDVREHGSGNIGASNVWRTLGPFWGIAVFLFDFCKGYLPTLLAAGVPSVPDWLPVPQVVVGSPSHLPDWLPVAAGLAAIMGHNFSPFLKFKGGKGVATSLGVVFGLSPLAAGCGFGLWLLCLLATRYISVSSIVGAFGASLILAKDHHDPAHLAFAVIATAFVVLRHQSNLKRLQQGTEPKVSFPWTARATSP